jgi:O-antigen/teichoic acid export membrane protein
VAKNSAALFLVAILTKGAGLVVAVLIARFQGPAALGTYAAVMGLGLLLEHIAPLGLPIVIIREVARDRTHLFGYWLNSSLVAFLSSLVLSIALVVITHLIGYEQVFLTSVHIVAFYLPIAGLNAIAQATVQGLEQMEHMVISVTLGRLLGLLILWIFLQWGMGVVAAFFAYGIFLMVAWLVLLRTILRYKGGLTADRLAHIDLGQCWTSLRVSYAFAIQTLLTRALVLVGVLVLPSLVTMETVGMFDAADRVRQTSAMIIPIVTLAILPTLSRTNHTDQAKVVALLETSLKLLQVVVLPFVFFVAIAADQIIPLLYGFGYDAAVPVMRVVIWAQIFYVTDAVLNQILIASDNERPMVRRTAFSLAINVILLLVLVPLFGVIAAAWAVVLTHTLNLALDAQFVARHIAPIKLVETVGKPLLCAVLSGGVALAAHSLGLWLSLGFFIGSYTLFLWVFKVFAPNELYLARQYSSRIWQRVASLRE